MLDDSFATMGTVARVVRDADGGLDVRSVFAEIERRLSRFDPSSDLSRLNADQRACVPAGPLLRAAVAAALRAASLTAASSTRPFWRRCVAPAMASLARTSSRHRSRGGLPPRRHGAWLAPTPLPSGARSRSTMARA